MMNRVVINLMDGGFLPRAIADRPVVEWALDYARRLVPEKDIAFTGTAPGGMPGFPYTRLESGEAACLVAALRELSCGYENIIYVFGDCPFLDAETTGRMLENHVRYYANYTFADGYPAGITPEIVAARTLPALAALAALGPAGETPVNRETLFTLIQKDINAFDIETELSPEGFYLGGECHPWPGGAAPSDRIIAAGKGLLAARPTEIDFVDEGGIRGEVLRKVYLGETIDYRVRAAGMEVRVQKTRRTAGPSVGDACGLSFPHPHWYLAENA
jgi:hypothetical protein